MTSIQEKTCQISMAFILVIVTFGQARGDINVGGSLTVSERYDDNIFFTMDNRKVDFITSVSPSLSLTYVTRNLNLTAGYQGRAEFYARNPEANRIREGLSLDLGLPFLSRQIRGVTVTVTENLSYIPDNREIFFDNDNNVNAAPDLPAEGGAAEGQNIQVAGTDTIRNRAGVEIEYAWREKIKVKTSYSNWLTRYKGEELNDYTTHRVSAGTETLISRRTIWTNTYIYSFTVIERADDVVTHQGRTGARHQINLSTAINGRLGLVFLRNRGPRITLDAGIFKNWKRLNALTQYTSDIVVAGGLTQTATHQQRVVSEINYAISPNINGYIRLTHMRTRSISGDKILVLSYGAGTGMDIRFLSWLSGRLNYSYLKQDSITGIGNEGERNLVTIELTASAPAGRNQK